MHIYLHIVLKKNLFLKENVEFLFMNKFRFLCIQKKIIHNSFNSKIRIQFLKKSRMKEEFFILAIFFPLLKIWFQNDKKMLFKLFLFRLIN